MGRLMKLLFWFSCTPLVWGLIIYLCFGSTKTRVFVTVNDIIGFNILNNIRPDYTPPSIIRFHIADGLWAFSLTSALLIILYQTMDRWSLLLISFLSFILFELCQHYKFINGTADIIDLGFMISFSVLAFYLINKRLLLCVRHLH